MDVSEFLEAEPRTGHSKLMPAREAIERYVNDGDSVFLPFASWPSGLEREIARQRKKQLTVIGTQSSLLLPLAGCATRLITSYLLGVYRQMNAPLWAEGF